MFFAATDLANLFWVDSKEYRKFFSPLIHQLFSVDKDKSVSFSDSNEFCGNNSFAKCSCRTQYPYVMFS